MKRLVLVFFMVAVFSFGVSRTPPKYLGVPGFQDCLQTESMGSWMRWCMPERKPEKCSEESWHALVKLYQAREFGACGMTHH